MSNVNVEMKYDQKSIGKRIKKLREESGESQSELAEALLLTQNSISKIEKGETGLTLQNLIKICDHYNVSFDYLCIGVGKESILDLLSSYISFESKTTILNDDIFEYPVIKINKVFFNFLIRTFIANKNKKNMPEDVYRLWREKEITIFNNNNKNNNFENTETLIPLPPHFIFPDTKKETWKQSDLIRETYTYLLGLVEFKP